MSNLPAPLDPNLLPAYRDGLRAPFSQDVFLVEAELVPGASSEFLDAVPADFALGLRLIPGQGIRALTEGGTTLGELATPGLEILVRLLEAGKQLTGKFQRAEQGWRVSVWLQDL